MDQSIKLARILNAACRQISDAIPRLRGFSDISHYTVEINRLENEGDRITRRRWPPCSTAGSTRWS